VPKPAAPGSPLLACTSRLRPLSRQTTQHTENEKEIRTPAERAQCPHSFSTPRPRPRSIVRRERGGSARVVVAQAPARAGTRGREAAHSSTHLRHCQRARFGRGGERPPLLAPCCPRCSWPAAAREGPVAARLCAAAVRALYAAPGSCVSQATARTTESLEQQARPRTMHCSTAQDGTTRRQPPPARGEHRRGKCRLVWSMRLRGMCEIKPGAQATLSGRQRGRISAKRPQRGTRH